MSSGGASRSLPKRDEREKRDRERRERELTHALVGSVNKYRLLVASCDRAKTVFSRGCSGQTGNKDIQKQLQ